MSWDYDYTVRVGSGSHTALSTWCDTVRILPETSSGHRSRNHVIPTQHGVTTTSRKWFGSRTLYLEVFLSYGPTPATHSDGSAGHVYENRSEVLSLLSAHTDTVWLGRTAPHQGDVEIPIEVVRPVSTSRPRHKLVFQVQTLDAFWRDQSQSTDLLLPTSDSLVVGGDAPVGDVIYEFGSSFSAAQFDHTDTDGGSFNCTNANGGTITIDCGERTTLQGGSAADDHVTTTKAWWDELQPGTNNFDLPTGSTLTVKWYNKWL